MSTSDFQHIQNLKECISSIKLHVNSLLEDIKSLDQNIDIFSDFHIKESAQNIEHTKDVTPSKDNNAITANNNQTLDFIDYDAILNYKENQLLARSDPDTNSPLEECSLKKIGRDNVQILHYMMKFPSFILGLGSIDKIDRDFSIIKRNQFSKIAYKIRQSLQKGNKEGPYLQTIDCFNHAVTSTGKAYQLNPQYRYLVIE